MTIFFVKREIFYKKKSGTTIIITLTVIEFYLFIGGKIR